MEVNDAKTNERGRSKTGAIAGRQHQPTPITTIFLIKVRAILITDNWCNVIIEGKLCPIRNIIISKMGTCNVDIMYNLG